MMSMGSNYIKLAKPKLRKLGSASKFRLASSTSTQQKSSDTNPECKSTSPEPETEPIEAFFAKYPRFTHDKTLPLWGQFASLCKHYKWGKKTKEKKIARSSFGTAITSEFGRLCGTEDESLSSWQKFFRALDVSPTPDTICACRQVSVLPSKIS